MMTGFEPGTFGIGSGYYENWATTTAPFFCDFATPVCYDQDRADLKDKIYTGFWFWALWLVGWKIWTANQNA